MTREELRELMYRNGDELSYPHWATQEILWNGEPVTVASPSRPLNLPSDETGD